MLKTRSQVKRDFARKGMSISAWASRRGYSDALVLAILNDDDRNPVRKCSRGQSHNIAVELGLKEGEIYREPQAA